MPSFACYGSWNPCTQNTQNSPSSTLADDGVAGYISTGDSWTAQDEGGTWIWDFGASHTGTFTVKWYAVSTKNPSYCDSVTITLSASNNGAAYTTFNTFTETSSTPYGSANSPIVSSITGTYRYVEFDQHSSTSCISNPSYGYVDVLDVVEIVEVEEVVDMVVLVEVEVDAVVVLEEVVEVVVRAKFAMMFPVPSA